MHDRITIVERKHFIGLLVNKKFIRVLGELEMIGNRQTREKEKNITEKIHKGIEENISSDKARSSALKCKM